MCGVWVFFFLFFVLLGTRAESWRFIIECRIYLRFAVGLRLLRVIR